MTLQDTFLCTPHSSNLCQPLIVPSLEKKDSIKAGEKAAVPNSCPQPCCPKAVPKMDNSTCRFRDSANITVPRNTGDQQATGSNKE